MRFEIVGDLWARLVAAQSLTIMNLTTSGMLVESPGHVHVGSHQQLRLTIGDEVNQVGAIVRHIAPVVGKPNHYLVGLAFVDLPPESRRQIEALCAMRVGTEAVRGA
jgi:hypothetical protein